MMSPLELINPNSLEILKGNQGTKREHGGID